MQSMHPYHNGFQKANPPFKGLFSEDQKRSRIEQWYKKIPHAELYPDWSVTSLTTFKNLSSLWMHEFLQFILEDRQGGCARIFAERDSVLRLLSYLVQGSGYLPISSIVTFLEQKQFPAG